MFKCVATLCLWAIIATSYSQKEVNVQHQDTVINKQLDIRNKVIIGVNIFKCRCDSGIILLTDSITQDFKILQDTFNWANFSESLFNKPVLIKNTIFNSNFNLQGNHFKQSFNCNKNFFETSARFDHSNFENADFSSNSFCDTYFQWTIFNDTTNFSNSNFYGLTSFWQTPINGVILFSNSSFDNKLVLRDLRFGPNTQFNFSNTTFPDTIDFSDNRDIYREVSFLGFNEKARRGKPVMIYLWGTDISKIRIDYKHFRLDFPSTTLSYFPSDIPRVISNDDKAIIYKRLLENFKQHNQDDDYDLLKNEYIEWYAGTLSFLDRWWYVYLLEPRCVISVTMFAFFFLTVFNSFFYHKLNLHVYPIKNFGKETLRFPRTMLGCGWMHIYNSLIYTGRIFFGFTLDFDKLHFKNRWLVFLFFSIYIIGLIALFFLTHLLLNSLHPIV